jgi:hypothetical protein
LEGGKIRVVLFSVYKFTAFEKEREEAGWRFLKNQGFDGQRFTFISVEIRWIESLVRHLPGRR